MDSRFVAGFLLLTAVPACGARTDLPSDTNDSTASSPSCTITFDEGSTVSAFIAEGERIYYVENHGRIMAVDADTGEGTVLAQVPIQGLNMTHGLALDADWLYVTFFAEGIGFPALFQVPKTGGEPKLIAPGGRVNNVFVDETGVYWTNWLALEAKHVVFRQRPDGTTLSLGVIDETYDELRGIFRGTAGLLVSSETALLAFDIEGAGATTLVEVKRISYPFERDGALFYNVDPCWPTSIETCTPQGFYRALPDGTMAQRIFTGPFERVITDGSHWVFTWPMDFDAAIFSAPYPDGGEPSFVYHSPTYTSPRAVALTPTRLVLGTAWWEIGAGVQSICRDAIGL